MPSSYDPLLDQRPYPAFLSTKELAYLAGVDESTLRWMRNHPHTTHICGRPPFVKCGGRYKYPTAEALAWLIRRYKLTRKASPHIVTTITRCSSSEPVRAICESPPPTKDSHDDPTYLASPRPV